MKRFKLQSHSGNVSALHKRANQPCQMIRLDWWALPLHDSASHLGPRIGSKGTICGSKRTICLGVPTKRAHKQNSLGILPGRQVAYKDGHSLASPAPPSVPKTRQRVARKHFSSRRKSECELSGKCAVRSVKCGNESAYVCVRVS